MKLIKDIITISSAPMTLIDVGALGGVHQRWQNITENYPATVIGFEPDRQECERLQKESAPYITYLPYALSSKETPKEFYLTESDGNSTFFRPDSEFINRFVQRDAYKIKKIIEMETITLDSVMEIQGIKEADYIKIDTEGSEIEIIDGAEKTISSVFAIETEVWFNRIYKESPLFVEVDNKIRGHGFILFDIARSNFFKRVKGHELGGPKGQLMAGDAIYFRDILNHEPESVFWDRGKLIKCIILLVQYCYFDYALEVLDEARSKHIYERSEADNIRDFIMENGKRLPYFKGKFRLSELIKKLGMFLSVREKDHLGNW